MSPSHLPSSYLFPFNIYVCHLLSNVIYHKCVCMIESKSHLKEDDLCNEWCWIFGETFSALCPLSLCSWTNIKWERDMKYVRYDRNWALNVHYQGYCLWDIVPDISMILWFTSNFIKSLTVRMMHLFRCMNTESWKEF